MKKISVKREAVNKALHKFSAECRKEGYKSESRWLYAHQWGIFHKMVKREIRDCGKENNDPEEIMYLEELKNINQWFINKINEEKDLEQRKERYLNNILKEEK